MNSTEIRTEALRGAIALVAASIRANGPQGDAVEDTQIKGLARSLELYLVTGDVK